MVEKILVAGGAGYIGSHMVRLLRLKGYSVLVIDDLSTGFEDAIQDVDLVKGSIGNRALLDEVFSTFKIGAVVNFASSISVGESVARPDAYYANNVGNTLIFLKAMVDHGVRHLVFSSTAAVYAANSAPLTETDAKDPQSPYGRSKWFIEQALEDFDRAFGLKSVRLRYFNAAGAHESGDLGERHNPETHLIPLVLEVAAGLRAQIGVFGADYDTPDGTCIRDYVHVQDLCEAHLLALDHLVAGGASRAYNLGNSVGFSVLEVIRAAEVVTGREIPYEVLPRRAGDPSRLVADCSLIRRELGWSPRRPDLATIVEDAWRWLQRSH